MLRPSLEVIIASSNDPIALTAAVALSADNVIQRFSVTAPTKTTERRATSDHILMMRHGLKVIWINAVAHATGMIKLQSVRDWLDHEFVNKHVNSTGLVFPATARHAIAPIADIASPEPALIGFDNAPEDSFQNNLWSSRPSANALLRAPLLSVYELVSALLTISHWSLLFYQPGVIV